MPRYIDADKVMDEIKRIGGHYLCEWDTIGVCALIERQPTADVEEVKHGEWRQESNDVYYWYVCSECLEDMPRNKHGGWSFPNYCPNCGAKMDGKE